MRKLTRTMLMGLGVKCVYEAADGLAALQTMRTSNRDIMLLEWDMPSLDGPALLRIVRAPNIFPIPDLAIIMLTNKAHHSNVSEAMRLGAHEFLVKPTSPQALLKKLISIVVAPRRMVQVGKHYVPEPRLSLAQGSSASDYTSLQPVERDADE
jgi:CheY-like chemotaxis protein